MSLPVFLVDALPEGEHATLTGPEGHHAATVQRLQVGEGVSISDGRGGVAVGKIVDVDRSSVELRIIGRRFVAPPSPRLVVVQGIAKADRGELAVQAMTEVGVDEIVPWAAVRSVVRWRGDRGDRAWRRWRSTAREAAKQARRPWLPVVAAAAATTDVADRLARAATGLVLHEQASARLSTVPLPEQGDIVLVVGPEGGVAPGELAEFTAVGASLVRLGTTVLRTSTAGVAALSVLSVRLRRW